MGVEKFYNRFNSVVGDMWSSGLFGILMISVISLTFASCSSTSWVVVNEEETDINDFELVSSQFYLESTNGITPTQPLIHFDLKKVNLYEYAQRVKTERFIQRYRPRLGYVMLGVAGAGLSYYAAFSDRLLTEPSNSQRFALVGAGTMLTGLSFLNMKPVGEPSATGESRLLRKTGTVQEADTSDALPYNDQIPTFRISYNDSVLVRNEEREFSGSRITINLTEEIDAGLFNEDPTENILVEVSYDSLSIAKEIPVSSIFEQFVVVNAQITALRTDPSNNPNNILTDLAEGSQLKLVERRDNWYKVLYGISETWVSANDVQTIWRSSEFASDLSVIAIPNVPFGSVDVEKDIPVLTQSSSNSSAFILSNYQYEEDLSERIYGQRDARLMQEYFLQAFGMRSNNIVNISNINTQVQLDRAYSRLINSMNSSDNLYLYLSGYAEIRDGKVFLVGSVTEGQERQYIDLHDFFAALNDSDLNRVIVFADLDFIDDERSDQALQKLASVITDNNSESAVIFGASSGQRSAMYSSSTGEQKRHSIFTYYLAQAFKQGKTSVNEIRAHLERNVPFTSRSIYDRPQNPLFFGNVDLELTD